MGAQQAKKAGGGKDQKLSRGEYGVIARSLDYKGAAPKMPPVPGADYADRSSIVKLILHDEF